MNCRSYSDCIYCGTNPNHFRLYGVCVHTLMFLGKNFGDKKLWRIGTQDMFGRETIGTLRLYTEGNQKVGR